MEIKMYGEVQNPTGAPIFGSDNCPADRFPRKQSLRPPMPTGGIHDMDVFVRAERRRDL